LQAGLNLAVRSGPDPAPLVKHVESFFGKGCQKL
jgi:hypothetical protein